MALRGFLAHALAFHRRERTRSHRTVIAELFRTAEFLQSENPIVTSTVFPNRTGDVTFEVEISIDGVGSNGLVFEFGSSLTGAAIYINGSSISFSAGDAANDGVTVTAAAGVPAQQNFRIVAAVRAGTGEARLWVDGRLLGRGTAPNGKLPNGWSGSASGAVGTFSGPVSARVPVPQAVALTNASVVGPLKVYMKQVPRHFSESLFD